MVYSSHARHVSTWLIVPASYDEYTALVKSGNVASKHVWKAVKGTYCWWKPGYRDLLSSVTFLLVMWCTVLCCYSFSTRELCSCASVVIFSNSVVNTSLSSFFVPFSVISVLRSARCMSLLSVGVVE